MASLEQALFMAGLEASTPPPAPLDITALYGSNQGLWLDFTDGATVFSDVAGATSAVPGVSARSIRSKSPEATLVAVSPAVDWPWTVDGNGATSAELSGTQPWMRGYALPLGGAGVWTQVALFTTTSGSNSSLVDSDLSGQRTFQGLIVNTGGSYFQLFGPANAVGDSVGAGTPGNNVQKVVSARVSQAVFNVRMNRTQTNAGSLTHALPTGYSANLYIGAAVLSGSTPPYNRYQGRIYAVMMINRYLSDVDVYAVETEMLRAAGVDTGPGPPGTNRATGMYGLRATMARGSLGSQLTANSALLVGKLTTVRAGLLQLAEDAVRNLNGIRMGARGGALAASNYGFVNLAGITDVFKNYEASGSAVIYGHSAKLIFQPNGQLQIYTAPYPSANGAPFLQNLEFAWANPTTFATIGANFDLIVSFTGDRGLLESINMSYDAGRGGYVADISVAREISIYWSNTGSRYIGINYGVTPKPGTLFQPPGARGYGSITIENTETPDVGGA